LAGHQGYRAKPEHPCLTPEKCSYGTLSVNPLHSEFYVFING
jgi:hypothetical protein